MSNPEKSVRTVLRPGGAARPPLSSRAARWLGRWLAHLRTLVRGNEVVFVLLAVAAGAVSRAAVDVVSHAAQFLHELAFGIGPGEHLSASTGLPA